MKTRQDAIRAINRAWPDIQRECLSVLGSELHYQAQIYHLLRSTGQVPAEQIGMNVKMWISNPVSELFKRLDQKKHEDYRGGFEPIPDVVLFKPEIEGDWRRRNRKRTLVHMLAAIEVKASERRNGRLRPGEIIADIEKLAAHREEVEARGGEMLPIMMIVDSARDPKERMTDYGIKKSIELAKEHTVEFMYASPTESINTISTD